MAAFCLGLNVLTRWTHCCSLWYSLATGEKKTEQFVVVQENILFTTILPQLNEHVENDA